MLSLKEKKGLHKAILQAEKKTTAEIHVAIYKSLKSDDVLVDAQKYFTRMELHQNVHKNNVLIYIVESARRFAILGDQGIHEKVGDAYWQGLSSKLSEKFKRGEVYVGLLECIHELEVELERFYPVRSVLAR